MIFFVTFLLSLFLFFLIGYFVRTNKILLFVFIVAYSISMRAFIVQAYKIPAGSMLPTIEVGDHILTNKLIYRFSEPSRGDLIIFPYPKDPNIDYIKRIVAIEGDTIEIKNKNVFLNGQNVNENYAAHLDSMTIPSTQSSRDFFGPTEIPKNHIFVMGDNRDNSSDSRFWGFINRETVSAKVEMIYWSWDYEKEKIRWDRIGKFLQ